MPGVAARRLQALGAAWGWGIAEAGGAPGMVGRFGWQRGAGAGGGRAPGARGGGGGGGGGGLLENANPLIYERSGERPVTAGEEDEEVPDSIDAREIFDIRCCWALAGQ